MHRLTVRAAVLFCAVFAADLRAQEPPVDEPRAEETKPESVAPETTKPDAAEPDAAKADDTKRDDPQSEAAKPEDTRTEKQAEPAKVPSVAVSSTQESICLLLESAARSHDLPLEFFARVIWQESRFQASAIGPLTRSGKRAQGIAQFMPGTAAERNLLDPFDPVQALPKSAEFLRELRGEFGNLGLAAAAYNAGPRRVREWLAGTGPMPSETRGYVYAITGASVDDWAAAGLADIRVRSKPESCGQLVALLKRAPTPFIDELERRVRLVAMRAWGVQLSAGFSRDRALATYASVSKRFAGILQGVDPSILRNTLRSRGTRAFYQVRVGLDSRREADDLCNRLRKQGGACMVLKNRGVPS